MDSDPNAETILSKAVIGRPGEQPGAMIGRYKLLEPLGEGGMGTVWIAEQREPLVRRVALKIIKAGMDTAEVVARFEQERQALALMDHPCVAKVFDAGTTDSGRPFFVMELVTGVPLTTYCDEQKPDVRARLSLFILICQAIQHAHQKGIIHRDLKPSNILVTAGDDGSPRPKVIDFGIAKATGRALTDRTLTQLAQIIGTPAYMSPEQAGTGPIDIDTRSDIYSLGVLLYELLTGRPPFDPRELASAGFDEMRRVIREKEPPRPSTRISSLPEEELTAFAIRCRAQAPRLANQVRGDLDWIVMKALEKNRNRRYESAAALAQDIQRHQENQPVFARPPGRAYLFSRFVRRHKFGFAAGTAIALALIGGIGATLWGLHRANLANVENKQNLHRASMADLATALRAIEECRDAEAKGRRAEGIEGKSLWCEAVVLLTRSLERNMENHRSAAWLYETLRRQPALKSDCPVRLFQLSGPLELAVFSSNGARLATLSKENAVQVWDTADGHALGPKMLNTGEVTSLSFNPSGTALVITNGDGTAQIDDFATGQRVATMSHGGRVWRGEFNSDGTRVLTAGDDDVVRIWDAKTGRAVGEPMLHRNWLHSAHFSPDSSRVVTGNGGMSGRRSARRADTPTISLSSHGLHFWDAATGQAVANGRVMPHEFLLTAASSPNGTRVVTGGADHTARVWDATTGDAVSEPMRHEGELMHAAFSQDNTMVVTVCTAGTARVWDASTGHAISEPMRLSTNLSGAASFSPDGTMILTIEMSSVRVWDALTGRIPSDPMLHNETVAAACFSPNGTQVFSVGADGILRVWDVPIFPPPGNPVRHNGIVSGATWSPDGTRIVTASIDGTARVWDVTTAHPVGEPMRHDGPVRTAIFNSSGTRIVTGSQDMTARVWDAATGLAAGEPMRHERPVLSAIFSPDGTKVITYAAGNTVHIWDIGSGKPVSKPIQHDGEITKTSLNADNTQITVTGSGTICVWHLTTGAPVSRQHAVDSHEVERSFSPDRTRSVRAWHNAADVRDEWNREDLGEPLRHSASVKVAVFSPVESIVVTASEDMTARFWDVLTRAEYDAVAATVTPAVLEWAGNLANLRFFYYGDLGIRSYRGTGRIEPIANPGLPPGPWADLAKWINAAPLLRNIDVRSGTTLRQIAERERDFNGSGSIESLKSALQYDPTVPLARMLLAAALERADAEKQTNVRDPNLPLRAAFLRRYDLDSLVREEGKMKNDELAALWVRAAKHLLELPPDTKIGADHKPTTAREEALKAARKAVALAPGDAGAQEALKKAEASLPPP